MYIKFSPFLTCIYNAMKISSETTVPHTIYTGYHLLFKISQERNSSQLVLCFSLTHDLCKTVFHLLKVLEISNS